MTEKNKLYDRVYKKERNRLFGFIRKFVPSIEEAEDILQDVFYQFFTYENSGLIERVGSWLFKTAKNKIIDSGRKKRPNTFSETIREDYDEEGFFSIEDFLPSFGLTPEDLFLKDEFSEKFNEALEELSPEQKDAFVMSEIDGLSLKEISEITGVKVNTLLSRKHYAVKALKKKLNNYLNG